IVTHGWPGSIIEQLKIVDPLTNPTAHGGTEADAFDLVIPSMPGYGFSGKPTTTGWGPAHTRASRTAWHSLEYAGHLFARHRQRCPRGRSGAGESLRRRETCVRAR